MKELQKLVVIGCGGTGGPAAILAKALAPEIEVTLIREEENFLTRCATPYIAGGEATVEASVKDDQVLLSKGITLVDSKATAVDKKAKSVVVADGTSYRYDKLVLAMGARATVPRIPGADLSGVFVIRTSRDATDILTWINTRRVKRAIIVGAGAVGLEVAYILASKGITAYVVELLEHVFPGAFDSDMSEPIEQYLTKQGLQLRLGQKVEKVLGKTAVVGAQLSTGETIEAQMAVMSTGVRCNRELAEQAGLELGARGVKVNEYLQTSDPDIYAAGDLIEYESAVTGKPVLGQIRPNAVIGGRIIAKNALGYKLKFPPLINSFATKLFDLSVASAGITESTAQREGMTVISTKVGATSKHVMIKGTKPYTVKLIFEKKSGKSIGGQIVGESECAVRYIDVVALAIRTGMTAGELATFRAASQPELSPDPGAEPIALAAEEGFRRLNEAG